MSDFLGRSPEALHNYRISVKDWLGDATKALASFADPVSGSYFRDSTQPNASSTLTTPARTYLALVSASRHVPEKRSGRGEIWVDRYVGKYAAKIPVTAGPLTNSQTKKALNNFELAKLSDLFVVDTFVRRFYQASFSSVLPGLKDQTISSIKGAISAAAKRKDGEACIDSDDESTKHFFVTLHLLRAAHAFELDIDRSETSALVAAAKQFCIKQCYYATRAVQHRADPARLAFAATIYCQYEDDTDPDLIVASAEALRAFQQPTGNWPAIHPIFRKDDANNPWYIATHDLALCLTWLYFQPRVPDAARAVFLQMADDYFVKWVIPTYRPHEQNGRIFSGWSDDRATGGDMVVGWASAIVCHFLANYLDVLDDVINRRVIETLGLQGFAKKYLIEEGQPATNTRFEARDKKGFAKPIWIDLPPHAWPTRPIADCAADALKKITFSWTDPSRENKISTALAEQVIKPIYQSSDFVVGSKSVGLLDGPPGTRKTSLVTTIADILKWPYIPVPASVFFDQGFDMLEARASEVFRRLGFLTYCVIFFDEFEEFFKDRENAELGRPPSTGSRSASTAGTGGAPTAAGASNPVAGAGTPPVEPGSVSNVDSRTIAAFTTSAMLPRLQELHDQRKCFIFLATNYRDKIDEAIIRADRFDYSLTITHPKISRFAAGDTYLKNPGSRTLEKLNVDFDKETMTVKDSARLERISGCLRQALEKAAVKEALEKFNKSDVVAKWSKSMPPRPDDLYVWFRFIEGALEAAAKEIDLKGSAAAVDAAALKMTTELNYYTASAGRRGPASLVDDT